MKTIHALAIAALLPLAACGQKQQAPAPASSDAGGAPSSFIGSKVKLAIDKAKAELDAKPISIGQGGLRVDVNGRNLNRRNGNLPNAKITPQGELVIEDAAVATTPEQQQLLKAYRSEIVEVAKAGMDIGAEATELGVKAASEALKGVFSGASEDELEKRIEAKAEGIKASAMALCKRLPGLLDAQRKAAAAVPAFQPYATMDESDLEDCEDAGDRKGLSEEARAELHQDIQREIREGIREGLREAADAIADEDKPAAQPAKE